MSTNRTPPTSERPDFRLTLDGDVLFDCFFRGVSMNPEAASEQILPAIRSALAEPNRPEDNFSGPLDPAIALVLASVAEEWDLPTKYLPLYAATRDPKQFAPHDRGLLVVYQAHAAALLADFYGGHVAIHPKASKAGLRELLRTLETN